MASPRKYDSSPSGVLAFLGRALSTFGGIFGSPASSGYAGGRLDRLTSDWVMLPLSADQELRWNLRAIRARARELVRDNPFAMRFLHLHATNVIGPAGIRLQGKVVNLAGEPHNTWNDTLEAEWDRWGRAGNCTVDGRWSFRELERLIAKSLPQDGEVLIRLVPYFDNEYAFAVQIIDPDQLDHLYNRMRGDGLNEIRMGVEIDEWSRPVAYHVFSSHPSEYEYDRSRERDRIPAADIIHLYVSHRVGQTRGVSWFHPVLRSLKMYDGYQEAELVAARVHAAQSFFITSETGSYVPPENGEQVEINVEPGVGKQLDPGQKLESWTPEHPTTAFEPFTKQVLKSIAAGLGVTHANLSGDLAEANYSSLRAGMLPEREEWRIIQDFLVEHCHRRIYERWLSMAILAGRIKPGMRDPESLKAVKWEPRGWEWVDPANDLKAKTLEIEYGLNSRTRIIQESGQNPDEIFAELEQEQKVIQDKQLAVAPVTVQAGKPGSVATAPTEPGAEGGDGTGNGNGNGKARASVRRLLGEP